jgi:hypothetical protein
MIQFLTSIGPLGYVAFGVSVATAILLFRLFFEDWSDFWECLRLSSQPDLVSIFRGEWVESHTASAKLAFWMLASAIPGWLVYAKLPQWWPGVFHG